MPEKEKAKTQTVPKALYANQVAGSFGSGVAAPFIANYANRLGASVVDLGWLQSIQNFFPNAFQIPWARMSGRVGRRVPFIVVGTSLAAIAYLMMIVSSTALLVILAVLFQAIATSAVVPAWSSLIGDKVPVPTRGRTLGRISRWAGLSGVVGGIVAAILVQTAPPDSASAFHPLFAAATVAGLTAAAVMFSLREKRTPQKSHENGGGHVASEDQRRCDFRFFVKTQVFYSFFMSFIWPIMIITQMDVLGASNTDLTILSLGLSFSMVAVQSRVGRLMDRVGPMSLITASRFMLIVVPLTYGLANHVYQLLVMNILLGAAFAIGNVAFSGYILDVAPPSKRAEYFATYNTAIGTVTFVGSLIGGYLAEALMGAWGMWLGLLAVYLMSTSGRLAGAVMTLRLKDCRRYPERMKDVVAGVWDNIPFLRPPE